MGHETVHAAVQMLQRYVPGQGSVIGQVLSAGERRHREQAKLRALPRVADGTSGYASEVQGVAKGRVVRRGSGDFVSCQLGMWHASNGRACCYAGLRTKRGGPGVALQENWA